MILTSDDLRKIGHRLINQKEEILDEISNTITQFKSELFERIDPILKEVKTNREERSIIENRLEALEEIHQEGFYSLSQ